MLTLVEQLAWLSVPLVAFTSGLILSCLFGLGCL